MLQNKDIGHNFWTVSEMLADFWINKLLYKHICTVWPPFINYLQNIPIGFIEYDGKINVIDGPNID